MMIASSNVVFDEVNTEDLLLYLWINKHLLDKEDLERIVGYLPTRNRTGGQDPGMKNKMVQGHKLVKDWNQKDDLWTHKQPPTSPEVIRLLVAMGVQIGVRELFSNFAYTFGGHIYHQKSGGPIGDRLTMCVALMVMEWMDGAGNEICLIH